MKKEILSKKPFWAKYCLHNLQRHFSYPIKCLIKLLNIDMLLEFLVSFGTVCHNELPRNAGLCMP